GPVQHGCREGRAGDPCIHQGELRRTTRMADVRVFAEGGYRYIKAVFQYSGGVAAQPGFEIERAVLPRPLPLPEGFAAIQAHLERLGRPLTAFCACELRSPAPFSEQGFKEL